ncbi:N-6 DNA methylase [Streptomyces sp. NPDC058646]|uniref:N-6 DNA methylase n=1 Tax=Streptomyces sp. NPDC058646 TaxID=3346574 RepID=UPI0036559FB5
MGSSTERSSDYGDDPQITRRRIAELTAVTRPTVTIWERRSADFPTPRKAGVTAYFLQSDILHWLDNRPVPLHLRLPGEGTEATYGARARRSLAGVAPEQPGASAPPAALSTIRPSRPSADEGPDQRDREVVRELMGRLADQIRGSGSMVNYVHLLVALHYLRAASGDRWETVRVRSEAAVRAENGRGRSSATGSGATSGAAAGELLDLIGRTVDDEVQRLGMLRSFTASLSHLTPRKASDLARVVDLVDRLGGNAFQLIIDEYERHARLRSREFFTPQAVVRLVAAIARTSLGRVPRTVYDPYVRGGEFLAESVAVSERSRRRKPDLPPVTVFGQTTGPDAALLAGLNLALLGVQPRVRLLRDAPWAGFRDGKRPAADLVLTNPPFNMKDSAGETCRTGTWTYGAPPIDNDNLAYVQHALASLRPGGRAAVVMPTKAGNSSSAAETAIRRAMVQAGVVECVIGMPAKLFSGTAVPVSVWLLRHPGDPCDRVLFLDARHLGVKQGRRCVLGEDDVRAVLGTYEAAYSPLAPHPYEDPHEPWHVPSAMVDRQQILDRDCSLNPLDHISAQGAAAGGEAGTVEEASARAWDEVELLTEASSRADAHVALLRGEAGTGGGDWVEAKLAELCEIKAGPSFTRVGKKDRGPDGPVPVVMPRHLREGSVTDTGAERVSRELADRHRHYQIQPGDILCVRSGKAVPPALVRADQSGWLMSPNVIRLRVREGREVDPEYLLRWLGRPESLAWIVDRSAATATPSISTAVLGGMTVRLPPPAQQRRIAELLAALQEQARAHQDLAEAVTKTRVLLAEQLMTQAPQLHTLGRF